MIIPTMSPQEVAQDARQDMRALWHKVKPICKKQEREHRKQRDRNCFIETHFSWRSPRGNNWLIVVRSNRKESTVSNLVWYRGRDERLRAVYVSLLHQHAMAISAHVLERYMERFDPGRDPIQRLSDFFFANHALALETVTDLGDGTYEVVAGLLHGLATGIHDTSTQVTTLTTFLDYGLLGDDQQKLAEVLDFKRELKSYPEGYRQHLLRTMEEERRKAA